MNDVFYIISMYELDLLKNVPLDNKTVREKFPEMAEKYLDMRKTFFSLVQKVRI